MLDENDRINLLSKLWGMSYEETKNEIMKNKEMEKNEPKYNSEIIKTFEKTQTPKLKFGVFCATQLFLKKEGEIKTSFTVKEFMGLWNKICEKYGFTNIFVRYSNRILSEMELYGFLKSRKSSGGYLSDRHYSSYFDVKLFNSHFSNGQLKFLHWYDIVGKQ